MTTPHDERSQPSTEALTEFADGDLYARCMDCGYETGDPDAHFWPSDGDEEVLPDDFKCPDGSLHRPDTTISPTMTVGAYRAWLRSRSYAEARARLLTERGTLLSQVARLTEALRVAEPYVTGVDRHTVVHALANLSTPAPDERDATIAMLHFVLEEWHPLVHSAFHGLCPDDCSWRAALTNTESAARAYRERERAEAVESWHLQDLLPELLGIEAAYEAGQIPEWWHVKGVVGWLVDHRESARSLLNTPANSERNDGRTE